MDRMKLKAHEALDGLVRSEATRLGIDCVGGVNLSFLRVVTEEVALAAWQANQATGPSDPAISRYARLRQLEALMKKNPFLPGTTSEERRTRALDTFMASEARCKRSNRRLSYYAERPHRLRRWHPMLSRVIDEARLAIFRLIGPGPTGADVERFWDNCSLGSGTAIGLKGGDESTDVDAYAKLHSEAMLCYTPGLLDWYGCALVKGAFGRDIHRRLQEGVLRERCTPANKIIVVPKDCDKDRVIAVEPLLNMYIQQGWKGVLTHHLKEWGITLENQSRNQELARDASVKGFSRDSWSTIDLSSASDTVSTALVRWFLPKGWYDVLDSCRCPEGDVGTQRVLYEKFSSMGNACTFPLQCLLFAFVVRAARAVVGEMGVY